MNAVLYRSPLITPREEKVFDGQYEEMKRNPPKVEVDGNIVSLEPEDLEGLGEIQKEIASLTPENVSQALGFKVDNFDGLNLYRGSKPGLDLHYRISGDQVLILSFGEFQAERFICKLEAVIG